MPEAADAEQLCGTFATCGPGGANVATSAAMVACGS